MRTPTLQTFAIPTWVPNGNIVPSPIARAGNKPVRVLLNNDGATLCFLSLNVQQVQNLGSACAQIGPGDSRVMVLAPNDALYAVSIGAGGQLNGETSDALPTEGVL